MEDMRDVEVWSIGELLMEIMRKQTDVPLCEPGDFAGPFPNGEKASMLVNVEDPVKACERLLELGITTVALKRGRLGSKVFLADREMEVRAFEVTPTDPTGAGDCYDAAFVVGMLCSWDLEQTALFANAAGALATTKSGPMEGVPTIEQALDLMSSQGWPLPAQA